MSQSLDELVARLRSADPSSYWFAGAMQEAADAITALRRDAERYRWLCEFGEWTDDIEAAFDASPKVLIDQAIDAAIAAHPLDGSKDEATIARPDEESAMLFGADAAEWLRRWDEGRSVWSIEMGGLGPGYEQCIHVTAAEILRYMLHEQVDVSAWGEDEPDRQAAWDAFEAKMEPHVLAVPAVNALGLSGAQWGAAMNLAMCLYRMGPVGVMADERVKDRHIQVSRNFPHVATVADSERQSSQLTDHAGGPETKGNANG